MNESTTTSEEASATSTVTSKFKRPNESNFIYGTLSHECLDLIFKQIKLNRRDTFMDLGHGDGGTAIYATLRTHCKSQGIELDQKRFLESQEQLKHIDLRMRNKITFYNGPFEDNKFKNVIVASNKIFVNNAEDIFGGRMNKKNCDNLDTFIAATFAAMQEGTILVSMSQMITLGSDIIETNQKRRRNNLEPHVKSSFFSFTKLDLPYEAATSWARPGKKYSAYIYERIGRETTRLCSNNTRNCSAKFQTAVQTVGDSHHILIDRCRYCGMKFSSERLK